MKLKYFKGRYVGEVLTMTPAEWHRIQDNPIRRKPAPERKRGAA